MKTIEYRVRPVTRYIVTRFHSNITTYQMPNGSIGYSAMNGSCGSESCGEFDRQDMAEKIALALACAETDEEAQICVDGRQFPAAVKSANPNPDPVQ